jgi:hypothetical protein
VWGLIGWLAFVTGHGGLTVGVANLDQVLHAPDTVKAQEDGLRHLLEVVGRQDAVNDDFRIRDLAPQPPEARIAARPEQGRCSGAEAVVFHPAGLAARVSGQGTGKFSRNQLPSSFSACSDRVKREASSVPEAQRRQQGRAG